VPTPDLLTTQQAASRLGVTPSTIRRWVDRGILTYVKLPSGVKRFREQDIEAAREPIQAVKDGVA